MRESVSKIINDKSAGSPGLMSQMVKSLGGGEIDMITGPANYIITGHYSRMGAL